MYDHMQRIAALYPPGEEQDRYVKAAKTARIPYYDFAIAPSDGQSAYPSSLQNQEVEVNTPGGVQTIANPLYSYRFHPFDRNEIPLPSVGSKQPSKSRQY